MGNPVDTINFSINGVSHTVSVSESSNHSLASYVREVAGLTGTKVGISKTNKQTEAGTKYKQIQQTPTLHYITLQGVL